MSYKIPSAAENALNFEEAKLANGLAVRLLQMPSYGAVHAMYTTGFGSIHRAFSHSGKETHLPAGLAHFLEHKMFENEDGVDAFSLFGETGAIANAYTSFDHTSYIFTATSEIERNLDILLSFVGHPHFTEKSVAKEQGIIGQEIGMMEDVPEMRSLFSVLECLYHKHPIRDDVGGTVESIATITPEMLYACTDAFYTPAQMALCVAGNVEMETVLKAVERANLPQTAAEAPKLIFPEEPDAVAQKTREFKMAVSMPMFGLGFKEAPVNGSTIKTEVACDMLTELICGETSTLYRRLYDEGLVQPGFGAEYGCYNGCLQFIFAGESEQPEKVREEILKEIRRQRENGIDEEQFNICKNMMYGDVISDLENVERVAGMLSSSYFRGRTPAEELAAIASITPQDAQNALNSMLSEERSVFSVIRPLD